MQNIEIKTPIACFEKTEERLESMGAEKVWRRQQSDTFFDVPQGWLKLREADQAKPQMISYVRTTESSAPRPSSYDLIQLDDAEAWKNLLGRVLPMDCVVTKKRTLWIWKHTRIHLDQVEFLGNYLELETVVDGISLAEAEAEANQVIELLNLNRMEFISIPYREMLRQGQVES